MAPQQCHFSTGSCPSQWPVPLPMTNLTKFSFHCLSPGSFGSLCLFLLPAGAHLRATLGILSGDICKTCPSHLSPRFLISRSILVHPVFWHRFAYQIKRNSYTFVYKFVFLVYSRLPFQCTSTRHVPSCYSLLTWQPEVKPLVENTAFMSEVWRSWRPP